jgi:hypothetical protein
MKKIFKKFWGVALVVMLLSTLLVIPAAPAGAANYAFADSLVTPNSIPGDMTLAAAGNGFIDVAQSGSVIYAIGLAGGANTLYKSADGGATWAVADLGATLPAGGAWMLIATAPDDPNYVVVVVNAATDTVYLSTNGGASFALLNPLAANANIKTVDISPLSTARYIIVGGSTAALAAPYLVTWAIGGFAWSAAIAAGIPVCDTVVAVKYAPTFASEEDLLVVTETVNVNVTEHIYSYPSAYNGWDLVDPTYPRVLKAAAALAVNKATIVLDDTFYAVANEIGFISLSITGAGPAEIGGVWNVGGVGIFPPAAYAVNPGANSVAWDGANLMVAPYVAAGGNPLTIYRSADSGLTWSLSSTFKTPGTGTFPIVIFNSGNGYCFSQGANSAIAMTTDLGKSFNGVKLINTTFGNMIDFWISSDAAVIYAMTDDGATNSLWRMNAGVWQRILIFTGANYGGNWLVRSADSDTTAVYLAKKGARNIIYSFDGGDFNWTTKFSQQNIADLAADSANLIYYASSAGPAVFKGVTTATSIAWTNLGALVGAVAGYSITLVPGGFVIGATNGMVGYYDGSAVTALAALGAANVVATASGVAAGDIVYAGSSAGAVGSGMWIIGTSVAWIPLTAGVNITGIAYANGVAYAYNNVGDILYRYLDGLAPDVIVSPAAVFDQTNMVNALQISTGSNTLWARDAVAGAAPDTINSYTEFLLMAVPALTFPVSNDIIPVNSLNGAVNPFNFMWTAPAVTALPAVGLAYTLTVYYDAAGTLPVAAGAVVAAPLTNLNSVAAGLGAILTPGVTYYWNVQVTAPIKSLPSAMASFTVQQLGAVVPVISSPPNGTSVDSLLPAFSWEPIAGATMYEFQLASDPEFLLPVYSVNTTTSGALMPIAKPLTDGDTYFWRVRVIEPAVGEWSQVGIFTVTIPVTPTTPTVEPTTTIILPTPTVIVTQPQPTVIVPTPTTTTKEISPAYIWAIIIIGAVLVIAVIVLIVRTRRSV